MRLIAVSTLRAFWLKHSDAEAALKAWAAEVEAATWRGPDDIRRRYGSVDFLPGNRVIFNIRGNRYRIVVKIHYNTGIVYVRFVGTHQAYDQIDAETI